MNSPEFMWLIYLALAVISPFAVLMMRDYLNSPHEPDKEAEAEAPMPPISESNADQA
jgi:proton-dependent oligopeptide transporter, POT family